MGAVDISEFLHARLDEDETRAREVLSHDPSLEPPGNALLGFNRHDAERRLRVIAQYRRILTAWPDRHDIWGHAEANAARAMKTAALKPLATIYSGHKDFRPEWCKD